MAETPEQRKIYNKRAYQKRKIKKMFSEPALQNYFLEIASDSNTLEKLDQLKNYTKAVQKAMKGGADFSEKAQKDLIDMINDKDREDKTDDDYEKEFEDRLRELPDSDRLTYRIIEVYVQYGAKRGLDYMDEMGI